MTISDHTILLLPAEKHRLNWTLQDMEIDHEVAAAPPAPHVVEASPTPSERREITNWLQKIHREIGHRDNRGAHSWVLMMAQEYRCSSCEESEPS